MTREELEHAIRAACDVIDDDEVYVIGSQAILGQYPNAPSELRQSVEADIIPKNKSHLADRIDGVLGELSLFHQTHGFYVHGLSLEAAILPKGWVGRATIVQNQNTGRGKGICLEAHDLAASKLVAHREKDREFVRVLLAHSLVKQNKLARSITLLPVSQTDRERLATWVDLTIKDLAS